MRGARVVCAGAWDYPGGWGDARMSDVQTPFLGTPLAPLKHTFRTGRGRIYARSYRGGGA